MFEIIMVPIDGSENAIKALDMAIQLQKSCNAELLILTVYPEHKSWASSVSFIRPRETSSTDEAMKEFAKEVAEKSKQYAKEKGVETVRSFYMGGNPAQTIVKFSEKHNVSLIVLGSRGLGNSRGDLLGSVSHKVTSLAKCPILVV